MPATGLLSDQTWATSDVSSLTNPFVFIRCGGTYLVVYDPATDPLEVIRILHGARDAAAELGR